MATASGGKLIFRRPRFVFGGFTLYDVQKILHHARLAERGLIKRDVVNESVSLELDFINIFVRMVQILGMAIATLGVGLATARPASIQPTRARASR